MNMDKAKICLGNYLDHIAGKKAIRAIAREEGVHASTILRRIRKVEDMREDPLMDKTLTKMEENYLK